MRVLREAKNMSLRALARRVEVTPSLISQIETGKINPSVASLYAIANALDAPMDAFFGRPGSEAPVKDDSRLGPEVEEVGPPGIHRSRTAGRPSRAETAPVAVEEPGTSAGELVLHPAVVRRQNREKIVIDGLGGLLVWERLTPEHEAFVDFLEIQYESGASSAQNLMFHPGREYGLVLEGELTVHLGFEEVTLKAGDTIAYDSTRPHRLSNRGDTLARAVWVVINREVSGD
jgi:transcriptional regulator with XRE-family HTH domain